MLTNNWSDLYLICLIFTIITGGCGDSGNGGGSEAGVSNKVATLAWDTPTSNVDWTALDNLAGYKIYYGTSSGNYSELIEITDPQENEHMVENLTPGTYYFTITTYDTSANETGFSNEVSKTIQ